jgi:monoterpene epsilon-lactone hydrolase
VTRTNNPQDTALSKQARRFWTLLRNAPKQIGMPLAEARATDTRSEDFTTEPVGVTFAPAAEVDGLWAETQEAEQGRTIVYFYGGGFRLGSPETRRKTAGHLALAARARVLVPNYRLAPEDPFPAALDDAMGAYEWVLSQGAEPARVVIAGDSAGGGLAVSTAVAARDRGLPRCAGVVALSPWIDLTCGGESMTSRAASDFMFTRASLLEMAASYLNGADPQQPLVSPLFADLTGLPSILCLVGGDEVLLDDSVRLARRAGIAGVDATVFIAAGMQHIFPIWSGVFPEADAAIALIGDWVRAHTAGKF